MNLSGALAIAVPEIILALSALALLAAGAFGLKVRLVAFGAVVALAAAAVAAAVGPQGQLRARSAWGA